MLDRRKNSYIIFLLMAAIMLVINVIYYWKNITDRWVLTNIFLSTYIAVYSLCLLLQEKSKGK